MHAHACNLGGWFVAVNPLGEKRATRTLLTWIQLFGQQPNFEHLLGVTFSPHMHSLT